MLFLLFTFWYSDARLIDNCFLKNTLYFQFENVLYRGNAKLCGDLCYEILRSCNSKLYSTRKEACALLYLLMRQNFEHTKKKSVIRVHLQVSNGAYRYLFIESINIEFEENIFLCKDAFKLEKKIYIFLD